MKHPPSMKPEAVRQRRHRERVRQRTTEATVWDREERRRHVYDPTEPHADLCEFDARGMDIIEGRT
jgi:hypothetical protein